MLTVIKILWRLMTICRYANLVELYWKMLQLAVLLLSPAALWYCL